MGFNHAVWDRGKCATHEEAVDKVRNDILSLK